MVRRVVFSHSTSNGGVFETFVWILVRKKSFQIDWREKEVEEEKLDENLLASNFRFKC